ncbi:MAG: TIM barrel protein [Ilumatobacteraceae bacterium]
MSTPTPALVPAFHSIHWSPSFGGSADLAGVIVAARRAGFGHIGLDLASVDRYVADGGSLAGLRDLLDAEHLTVTDVVALSLRADEEPRSLAARLAPVIDAVGAPLCVAAVAEPIGHDAVVAGLLAALDVLPTDVRLAIEFGGYMGLRSLVETVAVCADVGWDRAGVLVDSYQCARTGTALAAIADLGPGQIALVQFADAVGPTPDGEDLVTEARHHRLIPGRGDLPLDGLVDAVRRSGYDGPLAAEVLSDDIRASAPADVAAVLYAAMAPFAVATTGAPP